MPKKSKTSSKFRLILLTAILLLVSGVALALRMNSYNSVSLPTPQNPQHATPTPSSDIAVGNQAKTDLSKNEPTAPANGDTSKATPAPAAGNSSYIQTFTVSARGSGQYVSTVLSQNAASGKCSVTLTPTNGSPVSQAGTIISSGSYLSCDFGGILPVQGNGTAKLTVTGADGKTDTKETTF